MRIGGQIVAQDRTALHIALLDAAGRALTLNNCDLDENGYRIRLMPGFCRWTPNMSQST